MTKKAKTKNKHNSRNKKALKIVLMGSAVILLLYIALFVFFKYSYFKSVIDRADIEPIRTFIVKAVENQTVIAPIDPKTGDIYFPQARVFLPADTMGLRLTYMFDEGNYEQKHLSISNEQVIDRALGPIYGANNVEEMLEGVPKLQSCKRGVKLLEKEIPNQSESESPIYELQYSLPLQDGRLFYVYYEDTCPELDETAELLRNLQSY